ncbi:MAG: cadherin domain-containing protein [Pirellula sp.]
MRTSFELSRNKKLVQRSGRSELRQAMKRILQVEFLETRQLFAGDLFSPETGTIPRAPEDLMAAYQSYFRQFDGAPKSEANLAGITDLDRTFFLHSRPNATKTVYLDFDGFRASGTLWNIGRGRDPIVSPAWDPANNGPEFTNGELLEIQQIWQLVSADFSPFDVNVTTEDPGEEALVNTGGSDERWGNRVVFTPDDFPAPGAGGVAYIGSFSWNYTTPGGTDTPSYVFNYGAIFAAAAASHEVGHALGLSHDGTTAQHPFQPNAVYYNGHGTGEHSWGPIMGVGGYYNNVTTWDNGVYFGANNGGADANYGDGPDDLRIITTQHGFGYVPDEDGGTIDTATSLSGAVNGAGRVDISQFATIERNDDIDFFSFQIGNGPINLTINPYVTELFARTSGGFVRSVESSFRNSTVWSQNQGTNLKVEARLYDASGTLVAISTSAGLSAQFTDLNLSAGTYFMSVDGIGFGTPAVNPPTGFTDYGSIGEYLITGDVSVALGLQVARNPIIYNEDSPAVPIVTSATLIDATPGGYQGTSVSASVITTPGATDQMRFVPPTGSLITRVGTSILYQNVVVGTLRNVTPSHLEVVFNSSATRAAIEATVPGFAFIATGDSPETSPRNVLLTLQKGIFSSSTTLPLTVVSVNDAPIAFPASVDSINEDNIDSAGTLVRDLLARGVIDPDGETGVGIVISNGAISTQGAWQYRAGADWRDVGVVSISSGLVLGANSRVRFLPAKDFFGNAPSMSYYPIDPTYTGVFSTNANRATVNIATLIAARTSSAAPSFITQEVMPINDAPVSNYPSLQVSVLQDQTFTLTLPNDLFSDVDDTQILLSVRNPGGTSSPSWIQFDPVNRVVTGTPRNNNIGQTLVNVIGTDPQGLFGIAPLVITVIDVNDRPERVTMSSSVVAENSRRQRVGSLTTIDPDSGDRHTYSVNDPRFVIEDNILLTSPNANIDFEVERSITVNVTVTDSGTPPLSYVQPIVLNVQNVNEFPPRFPVSPVFNVSESILPGTLVGMLNATDADADTRITYQVLQSSRFFDVNLMDGSVRLKQGMSLDFSTQAVHEFVVIASDGQFGSAAQTVTVNVLPQNRFHPEISTTALAVSEGAQPGVSFGRILATDADPQSSVVFELIDSDLPPFDLNSATGDLVLRPGSAFDVLQQSEYGIFVRVYDTGFPSRSTNAMIPITIVPIRRPPTGVSVTPAIVRESISGLSIGEIQVAHTNANVSYRVEPIDSRFEVVNNVLRLREGRSIGAGDAQVMQVPMRVREVLPGGSTGRLFPLSVSLTKVNNLSPWQNAVNPLDVNRNNSVDPIDVLLLINALNEEMALSNPRPASALSQPDLDVDGDNGLSPIDVLLIVNYLNGQRSGGSAEGESSLPSDSSNALQEFALSAVLKEMEDERLGRRRRVL